MTIHLKKLNSFLIAILILGLGITAPAQAQNKGKKPQATTPTTLQLVEKILTGTQSGAKFARVDDMFLSVSELTKYRDSLAKSQTSGKIRPASAFVFSAKLWPSGRVPYAFDATFPTAQRNYFLQACREWEKWAKLSFVPRTTETNYISVFQDPADTSYSYVGSIGGAQRLSLASWANKFTACHELAHALGVMHEQCRSDRDTYVTINFSNIASASQHNFFVAPDSRNHGPYDFMSVMHYPQYAFAINGSIPTIVCNAGYTDYQRSIGQRSELSLYDQSGMATNYGPPTSTASYSLSGKVTSQSTGAAIANATVSLAAVGVMAPSDSNGAYTLNGLTPGTYTLTASATGYVSYTQTVTLDSNTTLNFALTPIPVPTYSYSGVVTSQSTGAVIAGAKVTLTTTGANATTDSNGIYTLGGLAVGTYTLTASANGYVSSSQTVTLSRNTTLNFALVPETYSLSGVVTSKTTGLPIADATVNISATGLVNATTTSDINGNYNRSGLRAGTYTLTVSATGYVSSSSIILLSGNTTANIALTPVTISKYALSGTVTSQSTGAALENATVTLTPTGATAPTNSNGAYTLGGLVAGTYTLTASANGYVSSSQTVTLSSDATLNFALSPVTYSVGGVVTSQSTGAPIVGATVTLTETGASTATNGSGLYSLGGLEAGTYTLTASANGYISSSQTVTINGNTSVNFSLNPIPTYALNGTVTSQTTGAAIAGAKVTLTPTDASATTTGNGIYTLGGLVAGTYTLTASANGYIPASQTVTLSSDTTINFALVPLTYSLNGMVTSQSTGAPLVGATVTLVATGKDARTDGNGLYGLSGLLAGTYTLTASADGYIPSSQTITLSSNATINFSLSPVPTYSFKGVVYAESTGLAISGSTVTVTPTGATVPTANNGVYTLGGLVAGTYTLTANASGYVSASQTVSLGSDTTVNFSLTLAPTPDVSAPAVTIINPPNGSTRGFTTGNALSMSATGTATDQTGIKSIYFLLAKHKGRKLQYYVWSTGKWTPKSTTAGLVMVRQMEGTTSAQWSQSLPRLAKGTYSLMVGGEDVLGHSTNGKDVISTFSVIKQKQAKKDVSSASPSAATS